MVKKLNFIVSDETHRLLRIALAEDGAEFSTWVRDRIDDYLREKGKLQKVRQEKGGGRHGKR
jgi:hypothetical protein